MKHLTKIIALSLALLLLLPLLGACSENTKNAEETKPVTNDTPADPTPTPGGEEVETEEETERWLDDVPETMDYGGRTLHFALY